MFKTPNRLCKSVEAWRVKCPKYTYMRRACIAWILMEAAAELTSSAGEAITTTNDAAATAIITTIMTTIKDTTISFISTTSRVTAFAVASSITPFKSFKSIKPNPTKVSNPGKQDKPDNQAITQLSQIRPKCQIRQTNYV